MDVAATAAAASESRKATAKTFCEFFAGIGLVRCGLADSRWRCTYANDIDPKKRELYEACFSQDDHFHLGDIWDTDQVVERIPDAPFLATASFPCVDLSLAGNNQGFAGKHSSAFFGFVEVLQALGPRKPPLVMIENVAGFLTSHGGQDFARAATALADLGYWLDALVLDAKYFVPQSRPRVFLIGVDAALASPVLVRSSTKMIGDPWRSVVESSGPLRPAKLIHLMESIELTTGWAAARIKPPAVDRAALESVIDTDDDQEWWDNEQVAKHYEMMSDLHRNQVDGLLESGGPHVGTIYRRKRTGKTRAEVRLDGIAGCLRTPRGGSARQIVLVIDNGRLRLRWMSPREYARLQGADDFPLVGKTTQQLFGFGDAVCVPAVRWIDQHILTPIFNAAQESAPTAKAPRPR